MWYNSDNVKLNNSSFLHKKPICAQIYQWFVLELVMVHMLTI
jgi:hypothetical protein